MTTAEGEVRRVLARLRRAVEKCLRELEALEGNLRRAEGEDFPEEAYAEARRALDAVADFVDTEAERLEERILQEGGLEPGRIRRSSAR